jgi:hypothetical protein
MNTSTFLCIAAAVVLLAILWLRERKREAALRGMAVRRGFTYLGGALPRSFTLHGTPFERATSIWNVIDGDCRGIRVIGFDCRIGSGKTSWRRTAIAAQSPCDIFGVVKFSGDVTVDRSGDWAILYQPKTFSLIAPGLMPVSELEARLDSIGP